MGGTWAQYLSTLSNDATYISIHRDTKEAVLAGFELDIKDAGDRHIYDVHTLLGFEMRKASAGISVRTVLAAAQDFYIPAPGIPLTFGRFAPQSIEARFKDGPFGRGWTHSFAYAAEEQENGDIHIQGPAGSLRIFQKLSGGTYQGQPGDAAVFSKDSTRMTLTEKSGIRWYFALTGELIGLEDRNGNKLSLSYVSGRLSALTHSNGDSISIAYANGRISRISDSAGRSVQYRYDVSGEHLTETEEPGGIVSAYAYHADDGSASAHALTQIRVSDAPSYHYAYDERGRLRQEWADGDANPVQYSCDNPGIITVTDRNGKKTRVYFGPSGEVLKVTDPLGNTVSSTFDGNGQVPRITGPDGKSVSAAYDKTGNPIGVKNSLNNVIKLNYEPQFNRLESLTEARFNTTSFAYDTRGNMKSITYPDKSAEYFQTDSRGNVSRHTNRRSQPIAFEYNLRGQVTKKIWPDGRTVIYLYNSKSFLLSANDSLTGEISMQYDSRNFLSRIDYSGGYWFAFEYNNAWQRTKRIGHDGYELNYFYDEAGQLEEITDGSGTSLIQYDYDAGGRLHQESKGNGTLTLYEYDDAGQLLHMVNYSPGGVVQSRFDYEYDENGNRTSMTTLEGKTGYAYDAAAQLVGVNWPDGKQETYEYDAAGNRIRVSDNGLVTYCTANNMNQYTRAGSDTFTYDRDGNMISKSDSQGTTLYEYDAENRLIRVQTPDKGSWEYAYDALGNRISVNHDGEITRYVHDPVGLVDVAEEYSGTGALKARYTHGFGLISRTDSSGNAAYYAFDGTGHTRQMTNSAGTVVNYYDYSPFGISRKADETIENSFQYVGRFGVMDCDDGLQYMRARYYNSQYGIFITIDPIRFMGQCC